MKKFMLVSKYDYFKNEIYQLSQVSSFSRVSSIFFNSLIDLRGKPYCLLKSSITGSDEAVFLKRILKISICCLCEAFRMSMFRIIELSFFLNLFFARRIFAKNRNIFQFIILFKLFNYLYTSGTRFSGGCCYHLFWHFGLVMILLGVEHFFLHT